MKIVKNCLKHELNLRTEANYPVEGVEFIDITPLILQKEVFEEIVLSFTNFLKDKEIDYIVAPEARGFLFGSGVSLSLGVPLIPVRKKGKLPPTAVEKTFSYEKEYGKDILELPKLVNDSYQGKKFYLLDDIYATGNTLKSIEEAIVSLGGTVVGSGVILNILELNDNKNLFSLIDVYESR